MKVKFSLGIGFHNAVQKETVEYEDDITDEEIEQDYKDWCGDYIDGCWMKVEGDTE